MQYMALRKEIQKKLKGSQGIGLVMFTLNVSYNTARSYIATNSDNLTKSTMLDAIASWMVVDRDTLLADSKPVKWRA